MKPQGWFLTQHQMTLAKQEPPANSGASSLIWLLSGPRRFAIKEGSAPNSPQHSHCAGQPQRSPPDQSLPASSFQQIITRQNTATMTAVKSFASMPASKSPVPQNCPPGLEHAAEGRAAAALVILVGTVGKGAMREGFGREASTKSPIPYRECGDGVHLSPNARAKSCAAEHPVRRCKGPLAGRNSAKGAKPASSCPPDTSNTEQSVTGKARALL